MTDQDKFNTLTANNDTIHRICIHVAEGGSMIDLCKAWAVPYGKMLDWINSDDLRYKQYQGAMTAQMYWAIDRVLKELKHMGTVDISQAYDEHNKLKPLSEIPEEVRRCISGVDTEELFEGVGKDREMVGYTKKIKIFDKIKALELIGKKFAMFIDRTKVDLEARSLEELIADSWKSEAIDVQPESNSGKNDAPPPEKPQTPP